MEAEYNALSMTMRQVLPLQQLIKEIWTSIGLEDKAIIKLNTTVYGDNVGALTLAKLEPGRMTPQSQFYGVKYHWF